MKGILREKQLVFKAALANFTIEKFLKIARFSSPTGFLLLLLPILWSIVLGATDIWVAFIYVPVFIAGAFCMRSAGCIINDICDAELDAKVTRTKGRPLASKEMSKPEALIALVILLIPAFLLMLTLPQKAIIISLISIIPIVMYPRMKTLISYPQIFLGLAFNLGILVAWYAVCDPERSRDYVPLLIYIAALAWTVGYDTIYALQDRKDDIATGIFSSAIAEGGNVLNFVWSCYKFALMILGIVGLNCSMNLLFYVMLAVAAYQMQWQVKSLDVDSPQDCEEKFKSNVAVGALLLVACLIGKI